MYNRFTMKHKVILFYKYEHIAHPAEYVADTKIFCATHNLTGRVLIAHEGINGTIEGDPDDVESYIDWMRKEERLNFLDVDFKDSTGIGDAFPKMKVTLKKEIVHLGLSDDVDPHKLTGNYMEPKELNELIHSDEEHYIIDMRNTHEFAVGRFVNSIDPGMKHFRNLPDVMDKIKGLKDKKVVTVCTGGIRCEKASGYLKSQGFENVSQLQGGMHRYIEQFGGDGWEGSLYVFDKRKVVPPEVGHTVVGKCSLCGAPNENYRDCELSTCGGHFIGCDNCLGVDGEPYCSTGCEVIGLEQKVA